MLLTDSESSVAKFDIFNLRNAFLVIINIL